MIPLSTDAVISEFLFNCWVGVVTWIPSSGCFAFEVMGWDGELFREQGLFIAGDSARPVCCFDMLDMPAASCGEFQLSLQ